MHRIALRLGVALALALALAGCTDGAGGCTEADCDSAAKVIYSGFSVTSAYDLALDLGNEKITVRCNDAGSMEEVDNPEYVTCDSGGFELQGDEANHTSILVTIYDVSNDEVIVVNQTVQLPVDPDGEITPNGPDCPPVCYARFGSVFL